jgi:hypothetical protein
MDFAPWPFVSEATNLTRGDRRERFRVDDPFCGLPFDRARKMASAT